MSDQIKTTDPELPIICPECGAKTVIGYGFFGGGGIGPYAACMEPECDFIVKYVREPQDD